MIPVRAELSGEVLGCDADCLVGVWFLHSVGGFH